MKNSWRFASCSWHFGSRSAEFLQCRPLQFEVRRNFRLPAFFGGQDKKKDYIPHLEYHAFLAKYKITFSDLETLRAEMRTGDRKKSDEENANFYSAGAKKTYDRLRNAPEPEGRKFLELLKKEAGLGKPDASHPNFVPNYVYFRRTIIAAAVMIFGIFVLPAIIPQDPPMEPISLEKFLRDYLPSGAVTSIKFIPGEKRGTQVTAYLDQDVTINNSKIDRRFVLIRYREGTYDQFVETIRNTEKELKVNPGSGVEISNEEPTIWGFLLLNAFLFVAFAWFMIRRRSTGLRGWIRRMELLDAKKK